MAKEKEVKKDEPILTEEELTKFRIDVIDNFVKLEKAMEDFIIIFFQEPERINYTPHPKYFKRKFTEASYKNHKVALFWKNFIFAEVELNFGFKQKFESFKFIFSLLDPTWYNVLTKSKPNYFVMIDKLCQLRNACAHKQIFIKDNYYSAFKKPKSSTKLHVQKLPDIDGSTFNFETFIHSVDFSTYIFTKTICEHMSNQMKLAIDYVDFINNNWIRLEKPMKGIREEQPKEYIMTDSQFYIDSRDEFEKKISEQMDLGVFYFFLSDEEKTKADKRLKSK